MTTAAENTKQVIDVAMTYTKQIVEALSPIARQTYDIGLLTLQIDAAQSIISSVAVFAACFFILRKIFNDCKQAQRKVASPPYILDSMCDHLPALGVVHLTLGFCAFGFAVACALEFLSVWVWAKLLYPDLWLAHQAVEKLLR